MLEHIFVIRKALERYKTRMEEVGAMGWYKDSTPTDNEIARIDAALAALDAPLSEPVPATVPPAAILDAMGRCLDMLVEHFGNDATYMPDQLFEDYVDVRAWLNEQPIGYLQEEKS